MNIFQLQCFLTVANTLSFARAAEQLNVSQPTITHQIKMLENELNVKLFRRSTRLVEITPEGQSFVGDAKSMVLISERAKRRFSIEEEHPMAVLSIGCSSYAELIMLSEVLNKVYKETPHFHPRLLVAPQDRLIHLLEIEQADIIFGVKDDKELKPTIKYKELSHSAISGICRYDHHLAEKEQISLPELVEESIIFCDPINIATDISKLQLRLAELHQLRNIHFSASVDSAIALATAGVGIAFLPETYIVDTPGLRKIALEDAPRLSFGMFYKSFPGDTLLKKFVQTTSDYFSSRSVPKQ